MDVSEELVMCENFEMEDSDSDVSDDSDVDDLKDLEGLM